MTVIGMAELVFATLALLPRWRSYGCLGMTVIMAGAVITRVMTGVGLPLMMIDAFIFNFAGWVVREQRPPFLAVHWEH